MPLNSCWTDLNLNGVILNRFFLFCFYRTVFCLLPFWEWNAIAVGFPADSAYTCVYSNVIKTFSSPLRLPLRFFPHIMSPLWRSPSISMAKFIRPSLLEWPHCFVSAVFYFDRFSALFHWQHVPFCRWTAVDGGDGSFRRWGRSQPVGSTRSVARSHGDSVKPC